MKTIYIIIFIFLFCQLHAQTTEFLAGINSGVSFFRGPDAVNQTILSDFNSNLSPLEYYGRKPGLNIGGEMTMQHISRKYFITGLSIGYDRLVSVVNIVGERGILPGDGFYRVAASGKGKLVHSAINFYPFIGKRFDLNKYKIDVNIGTDLALLLSAHQKGSYRVGSGEKTSFNKSYDHPTFDIRPRLQLKLQYHHIGVLLGYSLGLTEYYEPFAGRTRGELRAYSNIVRTGIFYKL